MQGKPLGRSDTTIVGRWFWTVDRVLLGLIFALVAIGIVLVATASPAAAKRAAYGGRAIADLFYLKRHLMWLLLAVPLLLATSMMTAATVRRLSLLGLVGGIGALILVPFIGSDVNGAVRWLSVGGVSVQPIEFVKPFLIVTTAWLLSLRFDDRSVPTMQLSAVLVALVVFLLVQQPDVGQSALIIMTWFAQAVLAGLSLTIIGTMVAAAVFGLIAAYLFLPHVTSRIDRFLTGEGDLFQISRALECFKAGGLFGAGPGEGRMKNLLPEPHTDYIFAVTGEEFGLIACLVIAILYLVVVIRVAYQLLEMDDPFVFLAGTGLVTQFGAQAFINMGVNLDLLPSKGMTLPFISYGGSSLLAMSISAGFLLALTRRNRYLKVSPYARLGSAPGVPA